MNFVELSDLGINTDLEILKRDTQRNSLFLYQHSGDFFADDGRIGNLDQQEAHTKYEKILNKAKEENIALLLTPEYSCPKSIIDLIIKNKELQPSNSKIWILGGESLNKTELSGLKQLNDDELIIYFEDIYSASDKKYANPLYYIFKGIHEGSEKLVILIQFKTRHMGGLWNNQLELNNLIEGNNIYILKNNNSSVRLITFVCSEAMNVPSEITQSIMDSIDWIDKPFLILNPQFNPKPSHDNFIAFRKFILQTEKKEIISLNWGRNTMIAKKSFYPIDVNCPRSGIFFKTNELEYREKYIVNYHKKGGYFLHIDKNKYVYYLNGNVDLFKIENKSIDITSGIPAQRRREGPAISNIFNFDEDLNIVEVESVDDNHLIFLRERGVVNEYLLNGENCIIRKERLVNISTGNIKAKEKNHWADIVNLNSFNLNEIDECNKRLTYVEDNHPSSESIRSNYCTNIFELDFNILNKSNVYPHSIKNLSNKNIKLAFAEDAHTFNYKYNIVSDTDEIQKATICYLGSAISPTLVNQTYDQLQNLFEEDSSGRHTVVVFYKIGNNILSKSNPEAGNITEVSDNNCSIL